MRLFNNPRAARPCYAILSKIPQARRMLSSVSSIGFADETSPNPTPNAGLSTPASAREQQACAVLGLALSVAVCIALIAAAIATGSTVGVRIFSALIAISVATAIGWLFVRCRVRSDTRCALALGSLFIVYVSGGLGGISSGVGQTFKLPFIDDWLATADSHLGLTSSEVIHWATSVDHLPTVLAVAYFSSVPAVIISCLVLSCLKHEERVWELCAGFSFCVVISAVFSALVPAAGPFEYSGVGALYGPRLPQGAGIYHLDQLHLLRASRHYVVDPLAMKGLVTFPSFHTAMALMTVAAWRDYRHVWVALLFWNSVVVLSTIPIGGHYVVDLVGGLAMWVLVFCFNSHRSSKALALSLTSAMDRKPNSAVALWARSTLRTDQTIETRPGD
jgi:membrane-associated phospholipid phosphatase